MIRILHWKGTACIGCPMLRTVEHGVDDIHRAAMGRVVCGHKDGPLRGFPRQDAEKQVHAECPLPEKKEIPH